MTTLVAMPTARPASTRALGVIRFGLAVLAAHSLPGSLLLLGYLQRRTRWEAARQLARSYLSQLAEVIRTDRFRLEAAVRGLIANFREGLGATVALAALTLPPGTCMAISWYAGWNNSFNKGYEHAAFGPLLA